MRASKSIFVSMAMCLLTCLSVEAQTVRSEAKVRIAGEDFYVHHIQKGDTFYSIGKVYNVADTVVIRHNPLTSEGLKVGQTIKIPVMPEASAVRKESVKVATQRKGYRQHIVQKGETAYSISKLYGIPLSSLIDDNREVDPLHLPEGATLYIRKKEQGDASPMQIQQQWEEYREAINSVSDDAQYHIVRPGETLYSLSKQYNIPVDSIAAANNIVDGNLKLLSMIRIPNQTSSQVVVKADSLLSLSAPLVVTPSDVMSSPLSKNQTADVALMLPLRGVEKSDRNFLDFYQGVLVALDEIKQDGLSVNLQVYNTERKQTKVAEIVSTPSFDSVDLVIGPVYNDEVAPVLHYAETKNIPVISPLSTIKSSSKVLFQAAPDAEFKFEKLDSLISSAGNIVVVSSPKDDADFAAEVKEWLSDTPHLRYHYDSATDAGKIVDIIDWDKPNLFVVLAADEMSVDKTLASISSAYNNTSARTARTTQIKVLGSSRWLRYNALDKNLYFKLGVNFVASYHADRTNSRIRNFDARYIAAFNDMPSLYSYKGYDVTKSFVKALFTPGSSFDDRLNSLGDELLQSPYHYAPKNGTQSHVNTEWVVVGYNPDYTIRVR